MNTTHPMTVSEARELQAELAARLGCTANRVWRAGLLALRDAQEDRQREYVERSNGARGLRVEIPALERYRRTLLDVLPAEPPGATRGEIEAALGRVMTNNCRIALRALVADGLVVRVEILSNQPRRYYLAQNEASRPDGNGTAREVAEKERRDPERTAAA